MTEVIWTPPARNELRKAFAFIANDNPRAAEQVRNRIQNAADDLVLFPNRGRYGIVENTRELLVPHTSYIIVYRVIGDVVWLLDIFHSAQDYHPEVAH